MKETPFTEDFDIICDLQRGKNTSKIFDLRLQLI
jgi:hypothetical protein